MSDERAVAIEAIAEALIDSGLIRRLGMYFGGNAKSKGVYPKLEGAHHLAHSWAETMVLGLDPPSPRLASLLADAAVGRAFNSIGIRFTAADLHAALAALGNAADLDEATVMVAARAAAEALDAAALGDEK